MKWWIFRWGTWSKYKFPPYLNSIKVDDLNIMTYYGVIIRKVFIGVAIARDKGWVKKRNKIKEIKKSYNKP